MVIAIDLRHSFSYNGDMDMEKARAALFDALVAGRGVRGILSTAYEILGFPMHFLDPSFRLIAKIGGEDLRDPRWLEYLKDGTISEAQLAKIRESGFVDNLYRSRETSVDPGRDGFPDILACDVVDRDHLLGRLGVWAVRPYGQSELDFVHLVAETLAIDRVREAASGLGHYLSGDYFLFQLLSDPERDSAEVLAMARRQGVETDLPIRMAVLMDRGSSGQSSSISHFIADRLSKIFLMARVVTFEDTVVALFAPEELMGPDTQTARALAAFADGNTLAVGVSRELADLSKVREAYREARSAVTLTEKESGLAYYEEVFAQDVVGLCAREVEPENLVFPPLYLLMKKDRESGSEYMRTLDLYLLQRRSMVQTAQELGIHYNTVKYRLEQIREALAVDLEETASLVTIAFSLMVLKKLGRLDSYADGPGPGCPQP